MAIEKRIEVNLDLKRVTAQASPIPPLVVGDNGNIFVITLTDGGQAVDLSACLVLAVFSKPDGLTATQDSDGHGLIIGGEDGNVITMELFTGSYGAGKNICELQVYSGEDNSTLVTTAQFNFDGRKGIMNDETLQAENNYPILVSLMEQVEPLREQIPLWEAAEESRADAEASRAAAEAERESRSNEVYTAYTSGALNGRDGTDGEKGEKGDKGDPGIGGLWSEIEGKPTSFTPSPHGSSHKTGGADALTPADIGAAAEGHTHTAYAEVQHDHSEYMLSSQKGVADGVAGLDGNKKVTASQASAKVVIVTANTTVSSSNVGKLLLCNSSSAITVTVPTGLSDESELEICRWGSGTVTIAAGSGVTLHSIDEKRNIANRYGCVVIKKVTGENWLLAGDLE